MAVLPTPYFPFAAALSLHTQPHPVRSGLALPLKYTGNKIFHTRKTDTRIDVSPERLHQSAAFLFFIVALFPKKVNGFSFVSH